MDLFLNQLQRKVLIQLARLKGLYIAKNLLTRKASKPSSKGSLKIIEINTLISCIATSGLIFSQDTFIIPFDWSNHNGIYIHEGQLFANQSWYSGALSFDGTYTSFPKRYGGNIRVIFTKKKTNFKKSIIIKKKKNFLKKKFKIKKKENK